MRRSIHEGVMRPLQKLKQRQQTFLMCERVLPVSASSQLVVVYTMCYFGLVTFVVLSLGPIPWLQKLTGAVFVI